MADGVVLLARISAEPLDPEELAREAGSDADGALVVFRGVVRDSDGGRSVSALEYEAHPSAGARLREVADAVAASADGVRIAVAHRTGELEVGDLALVAAVAAPHRAEAFAACSRLVDDLKASVPIWKRQRFVDGDAEWVGISSKSR